VVKKFAVGSYCDPIEPCRMIIFPEADRVDSAMGEVEMGEEFSPEIHFLLHHHHNHQGLDPTIRSVSRLTAARANASSVYQLFSFLVVCSGMISKGFGFVAFCASVEASSVCIHLSCLVCQ